MTLISDMDLPGSVTQAAYRAYDLTRGDFKAAIRAALQAMVDTGMARVQSEPWNVHDNEIEPLASAAKRPVLIIRLDADELKPKEQT